MEGGRTRGKLARVTHMFTLVTVPDHRFVAVILPDPARRKLRFLFEYNGQLRAMCWMMIGSDGSIYLNPRTGNRGPLTHGVGIADGSGGFSEVVWDQPDSPDEPNRKVSYHASGRIKGGARMSPALSLRDITQSTLIRQDEYAHPSRFAIIEPDKMRSTDIIVPGLKGSPYQLDDEHPLTSRVFAAPLRAGNAHVPIINDDPNARADQTAIVIPGVNLKDCQDLTYQIQFFNRIGQWPEVTMIAIRRPDGA